MSYNYSDGIQSYPCDKVFDLESASPEVFATLAKASPKVIQAVERLRAGVPAMRSAIPGTQGDFYRLKKHNRAFCWALSREKGHLSDVISLKGTEPLLQDFNKYLGWMSRRRIGDIRPITEHFPLSEGKAPGCVYLAEAEAEAEVALEIQRKHLIHYGELAHVPTPLFVFRLSEQTELDTIAALRKQISKPAFERVAPSLRQGLGIYAYYYPGPPVRVHAIGAPWCFLKGQEMLGTPQHIVMKTVPKWIQLYARLLWLGYLPVTPLAWRLGSIFDPNNACLDGGGCDVGTVFPMAEVTDDGFFGQSMLFSFGSLRQSIAAALGLPVGEVPRNYREAMIATCLEDSLRKDIERAVETNAVRSLNLDARVSTWIGSKSLRQYLEMFQVLDSYLKAADYSDRV